MLGKVGAGLALPHFPSVMMAETALSKNKLSWFVDLNLRIYIEAVEKPGTRSHLCLAVVLGGKVRLEACTGFLLIS